ncbi:MAG: ABC transporter substrate-binding protein [Thermomicrobiales bacterium]
MQTDSLTAAVRARVTRRVFLGGAAGAASAAILAACGGNPDVNTPTAAPVAATTGANTTGASTAGAASAAVPPTAKPNAPATSTPQASSNSTAAASANETPQPGGRLIIADAQADNPLDPFKTSWHSTAQFLVFTAYVSKAPDLSYVPYTFDSWQISPDSKEVTFKIKQGIKNSDGTAVDAASLKFIIDRLVDPQRKAPGASAFGALKSATVIDNATLKLSYDAPYAPLFNNLTGSEVSSMAAVQKYGDDFTNHPVGPGPYLVKDQIPGNSIVYDRNPDYNWPPPFYKNRGPAYLDGITMKIIKEDATTWAALKAGEVHIAPIPTTYIKEADTNQDITVIKQLDTGIRYLGMNCSKPPFNDPLVRQAVSHAIDRDSIVANALDGYGQTIYTPLAAAIAFSDNEGMKKISYLFDPAMAKQKLTQAGYDLSSGMATKGGQPFEVTLLANNTDFFKRAAQIVQSQLKDVGIKVNIQVTEGTALNDATVAGTHQMFLQLYGSTDPSIMFYFFDSSRIKATNRAWYSSPELDALLEQGQAELDPAKQKDIYEKVQQMVVQASPWVTICNPYVFTGVRKEVRGFQVHPQGTYLLHDTWMAKK